ncbi:hypothetical protein J3R82DRAFT_2527 [Butyriboletus roseoflavus]|nr:hypothetical protein J3R82DRAFT_2527 [Butyriboletus roseoflavus]
MYDHNKGPASAPRHDAYLVGAYSRLSIPYPSPDLFDAGSRHTRRFRSVPEFIPHALWLLTDPNLVRSNCNCKYCNKKPQREITASMGLLPRRSTPLSAPPAVRRATTGRGLASAASAAAVPSAPISIRPARERAQPYAAIRRVPRPVKQSHGPKQSMLRERNVDLRSAYAEGVNLRKWYRDGELLWCALNTPIPGLTCEKDAITFWPGIVEEARMKAEAIKFPAVGEGVHIAGENGAQDDESSKATQNGNGSNAGNKEVPWTVIQTLSYKVKLLGIPFSYYIPADQVLPYQAHAPSDELIQAIHRVPIEQMNTDTDSFRPTDSSTFIDAAAAYAVAVQIAANLAGYWAPTDDWEYKFSVPPPNVSPTSGIPPRPMPSAHLGASLDSVMNASMTFNASLANAISSAGPSFAAHSHTGSVSAPPPIALTQTVTQTRYQGLWWGAERIWADELVRLKLSRSQIAPKGSENILPPAGPSRNSLEYTKTLSVAEGNGGAVVGAESRGVFMRIDGLYVADISRSNGTTGKVCRAMGMLYELIDEDWEGDLPGGGGNDDDGGKGKGKGKGKAIEVPATLENGTSGERGDSTAARGSAPAVDVVSKSKERSANEQLSHPILSSPFPLPLPPEGFKFRPILYPGYEAVLSLTLIAGRYYPRLLRHPLLDNYVEEALHREGGHVIETSQLWALEGLAPGYYNTMDPVRWRASRVIMVREADKEARQGLEEHWRARIRERDEIRALESGHLAPQPLPSSTAMDTDSDAPVVRQQDIQPEAMVVDS